MESAKLRIKSPSLTVPDVHVSCSCDETVLDLKKRIESEYETNPVPESQKLVYSGKLLQDHQKLRDFLRFEDECSVFTIHLVCRLVTGSKNHDEGLRNRKQKIKPDQLGSTAVAAVPSESATAGEAQDLDAIQTLFSNLAVQSGMLPSGESVPGVSQEDIQQYQALYSQYMSLYTQYMQTQSVQQQQLLPQPPQQEPAPAEPVDEQDNNNNNNDLLDYAYAIIRVVILFCIMYVHSSFFRLLFVAGGILLVYMLQNRNQREQQDNHNPPAAAAAPENLEPHNEATEEVQEATDDAASEQLREPKPNLIMVAFTFVTTLFSSIIPDQNQVN